MSNLNIETYSEAVRPEGSAIDCNGNVPIKIHVKRPDGEDAAAALSNQRASSRLLPRNDSALSTLSKDKAAGRGGCFNRMGQLGNLFQSIVGCGRSPSKAKPDGGANSLDTVDTKTMNTQTSSTPDTVVDYYDDCCSPKSAHETSSMDVYPSVSSDQRARTSESWDTAFRRPLPPPTQYPRKLKQTLYPIAEHSIPRQKGTAGIPMIMPSKTIRSSNTTISRRQPKSYPTTLLSPTSMSGVSSWW